MPVPLPDELPGLLARPSLCFAATIMPDGSPQLTRTWVSTDGEHILISTPGHSQKAQNTGEISGKYPGRPYPNFSGRPETWMIMTTEADSVRRTGTR